MAERDMRTELVRMLSPLDGQAVENRANPGCPDVEFIGGWIECKWLRAWPKREDTPVRLDHPLLPTQKVWIRKRACRGGKVWVMLRCRREWFLLDGLIAVKYLGTATRVSLSNLAVKHWQDGLDESELREVLRNAT